MTHALAGDVSKHPAVRPGTVVALGSAQTLSWASSFYLPAVLAAPMARDLGVATPTVFLAFSLALVVSAVVGPAAGRQIDTRGGRPVLIATNALFALALVALASAQSPTTMFLAWALMGVAMGSGLYEAAFAALVRLHGSGSRNAITGITLIAGFASTVGWPLSALMEAQWGWRGACLGWAALHLLLGVPLNLRLPRATPAAGPSSPQDPLPGQGEGGTDRGPGADGASGAANAGHGLGAANEASADSATASTALESRETTRSAVLLALVFALVWFVSTAMATHLIALLQAGGATLAAAVAVGALVGPAQVAGRLLEFGLLRRVHPLLSARLAGLTHPIGAAAFLALGPPAAAAFALLHGAGNGIMTIAKGTLPLALFGPQGYGARQGWLMMPARVAQALAPVTFGVAIERLGENALWLSAAMGLAAFAALMAVRARL